MLQLQSHYSVAEGEGQCSHSGVTTGVAVLHARTSHSHASFHPTLPPCLSRGGETVKDLQSELNLRIYIRLCNTHFTAYFKNI